MSYSIDTRCIHIENDNKQDRYGAISYPIYQTATFAHPGVGMSTGYDYSRAQNPTRENLEKVVASLENGSDAIAFSSGMAAITALMELFVPQDHLIVDADLYGGTVRLFNKINSKNGISFTNANISKDDIESLITEKTKAIYIETPTNPMMNVTDLAKVNEIAKAHNLLMIVDNTFMSPYFQNPIDFGADIVVHSGTKYLGGHNDTIAGFLVTANAELGYQLREIIKTVGSNLAPFDCFMIRRGIQTLAIRMERAQENAIKIANWLETRDEIKRVIYPGLTSHPGYDIMKRQARGFGGMLTFEVSDGEFAKRILNKVKLVRFAESLGGTETLITYPVTQTHADVPAELLEKNGLTDCILRLSVGIESADDLIADLEQAFDEARSA